MTKSNRYLRNIVLVATVTLLMGVISTFVFSWRSANHFGPPRISQDWLASEDFGHTEKVSKKFSEMLRRDFPRGSSASILRTDLIEQGFRRPSPHLRDDCSAKSCDYADTRHELEYNWGGVPCSQTLRVSWSEDARKRIMSVSGQYFSSCI